jgi:predicted N-acetyltransferase YhbS
MVMLLEILPLVHADPVAVEQLLDEAFGTDRHRRTAYRLREGAMPLPTLSFAVPDGRGGLAAVLQSWPVALTPAAAAPVPLVLVGPVAVAPALQARGLGGALMKQLLVALERTEPAVLIGDPGYYQRFGFSAEQTGGWRLPGPVERHRLMARTGGRQLPAKGDLGPAPR